VRGHNAGNAGSVCIEPPVHAGFRVLYGSSDLSSYFRERKAVLVTALSARSGTPLGAIRKRCILNGRLPPGRLWVQLY
jgi:hypothetical protein